MISSSVVYGHPVKYSYEVLPPMNTYQGQEMAVTLLAYIAIFSDSFIFGKTTSSHFFRVIFFKVTQELLFRSSSFFRTAAFFWGAPFSEQSFFLSIFLQNSSFFRAKRLPNNHILKIGNSLVQFRNSYLQKISTEELLFRSRFFCTTSTFSKKQDFGKSFFFRTAIFRITYFFWRAAFLMSF